MKNIALALALVLAGSSLAVGLASTAPPIIEVA